MDNCVDVIILYRGQLLEARLVQVSSPLSGAVGVSFGCHRWVGEDAHDLLSVYAWVRAYVAGWWPWVRPMWVRLSC